jgi:cell division transport system permease protein
VKLAVSAYTALVNVACLVVGRGAQGWKRNFTTAAPAIGSLSLLLFLASAAALLGIAVANIYAAESARVYTLHVYIRDGASQSAVDTLKTQLAADPAVANVSFTDKATALSRALRRPGMAGLVESAGENPFPASLDVTVKRKEALGPLATRVAVDPAVDPAYPTSYDGPAYDRLQRVTLWAAVVGFAVLALLTFVSIAVTSNAIRSAVLARRDEVRMMRLVGAPAWAVRGPFVIEATFTGSLAGALAGAVVLGAALLALQASQAIVADFLPGVGTRAAAEVAGLALLTGSILGGACGVTALRRMPR